MISTMGDEPVHHVIGPTTGRPASSSWPLVSATGNNYVHANALSTTATVWNTSAPTRLQPFCQAIRLLGHDRKAFTLGGWPQSERA
jgi:thiamine biosynthesis lipoprotein ApbE